MHARISYSRFVKALGFSVLPDGTGQSRKSWPTEASLQRRSKFSEVDGERQTDPPDEESE